MCPRLRSRFAFPDCVREDTPEGGGGDEGGGGVYGGDTAGTGGEESAVLDDFTESACLLLCERVDVANVSRVRAEGHTFVVAATEDASALFEWSRDPFARLRFRWRSRLLLPFAADLRRRAFRTQRGHR